jgi:hypothetical protein
MRPSGERIGFVDADKLPSVTVCDSLLDHFQDFLEQLGSHGLDIDDQRTGDLGQSVKRAEHRESAKQ